MNFRSLRSPIPARTSEVKWSEVDQGEVEFCGLARRGQTTQSSATGTWYRSTSRASSSNSFGAKYGSLRRPKRSELFKCLPTLDFFKRWLASSISSEMIESAGGIFQGRGGFRKRRIWRNSIKLETCRSCLCPRSSLCPLGRT